MKSFCEYFLKFIEFNKRKEFEIKIHYPAKVDKDWNLFYFTEYFETKRIG